MRRSEGLSLLETMVVIAMLGVMAVIALPSLVRARARLDVSAARGAFVSTHALARQVAAQYGSLSKLHLEAADDRFWVTVDTSSVPGREVQDTVGPVTHVGLQFGGVQFSSNRRLLCLHPYGLATAQRECELPNATVIFERRGVADTVTISRLGRVRRR